MHRRPFGPILQAVILPLLICATPLVLAQGRGPSPVRYTEAVNHDMRSEVHLPGTVESRRSSVVAAEVGAVVVAMEADEGDRVRKGQPLVRLRTISYELQHRAAEGRLKEGQARLELAESKLRRARDLFDDKVISEDQLDDAFSEFTAWQGRVDATEAEIADLQVSLERCIVRAPFDGIVVRKLTDLGQWMQAGGDVVEMVALDRLDVRVEVPERYYDRLRPGVEARVRFEAIPGMDLSGEVYRVIPMADAQARTFPVRLRIANPDGRIGVGMLANVALPLGISQSAVLVPKDALTRQGPQEILFRIKDDQTVEPVPVTSGRGVGAWIEVEGTVAAGDRIVTRGNERIFPGAPVSAEPLEYTRP